MGAGGLAGSLPNPWNFSTVKYLTLSHHQNTHKPDAYESLVAEVSIDSTCQNSDGAVAESVDWQEEVESGLSRVGSICEKPPVLTNFHCQLGLTLGKTLRAQIQVHTLSASCRCYLMLEK